MSNDELASNDEIKEFKEEGEEDRLASENLHSRLRHNLIEQVRCYNAIKVPLPSSHHHHHHPHHPHHRGNHSSLAAAYHHHLSSSLDTAHHHHHYLHPPPPAHMPKWIGLDLDSGQYPPPPLSHLPFSQWYPSPASGMYPSSPFYSPPHYLNFPTHPLPSPLSHTLFYSPPPPPPPPTTPSFNHHHHSHHHHPNPSSIPPSSSTSSTSSSSSSTSSTSSILSLSSTPHQQEQHQSTGQHQQSQQHINNHHHHNHDSNNPNSLFNFSHIKKPLNAFMLYMKENRAAVAAESTRKESATINQILGKNWHLLGPEEQAKYYEKAKSAREAHREQYPCWTAKDNYANNKKKKKTKREKTAEGEGSLKKCRARFGLDQQASWCKPCRRKKKCIRFSEEKTTSSI